MGEKMKTQLLENIQIPFVSVVMTIYKLSDYLNEAIESILKQTFSNFEFIIIVEYSAEQDLVVKELEKWDDHRIVICKNEKDMGIANSLNYGFEIAKGKYIARMDDDDISHPNRLEEQVQFLETHPEISVVGSNIQLFMGANNIYRQYTKPKDLKCVCLFQTPLMHPTVLIRKDQFDQYHLRYDSNYSAEDYELWSRAIEFVSIANIPKILLNYRISGNNTSVIREKQVNDSHLQIMSNQLERYLNLKLSEEELNIINKRDVNISNFKSLWKIICLKQLVFKRIKKANQKTKFYDTSSLNKIMRNDLIELIKIYIRKIL